MSFEVDRYLASWAHIALCADLTWAAEPPDEFIIANQRLWAQHCRISQVLQETALESNHSIQANNQFETTDKRAAANQSPENGGSSGRRSVKDVIPESRLAQFYGNFYYDEAREKCYVNANERTNARGYNGQGCENSDLTECWMLPEVEYWFRKLVDDAPDRSTVPRRRRQYRMLPDDDFERWGPAGVRATGEESALAARVQSVRGLWATPAPARSPRAPSPPPVPRKIRARRRQPRRLALAPPLPAYCLEMPAQLFCDPTCKFQFDPPRPPLLNVAECQRAMGRVSASVQAVMRATAARCPLYRGTNVSRYAPTGQRPARCPEKRYSVWWPRDHPSPQLNHRFQLTHTQCNETQKVTPKIEQEIKEPSEDKTTENTPPAESQQAEKIDQKPTNNVTVDSQVPSTSSAAIETGLRKKRLYSTVLSMSAPNPINLTPVGCVRLAQKLTPGLIKLNPKIALPTTRLRSKNVVDHKFEELEKEALEQYKASDESIDTKFRELEKQAVEQYSTSNSNTSCSSSNSAGKRTSSSPSVSDDSKSKRQAAKFHKEKVDSVVIYSQNFPDLNTKSHTNMSLKNFHIPPRGEKKEQTHRPKRTLKSEQRAASDTDYEAKEAALKCHKGPLRWTLHVMPPKKRHLTLCVSDCSSDEELKDATGSIKDAGPCIRRHISGKVKMSAHGGGDLRPVMRKT
ncbi:uncharacterized protein LOC113511157 isoform X2 [Galleria mellonella]|uniref:Uncharacterized protein LOC113511157 isoform X2 n=1 Tax=Galleria mellonella TaxID=7137 RepID=A0A6J1WIZ7_GALME|nr:uncharacterized protein LOC113511157 isoform X2 [Galleria mellonella]